MLVVANLGAWLGRLVTGIPTLLMPNEKLDVTSGAELFWIVLAFLVVPPGARCSPGCWAGW